MSTVTTRNDYCNKATTRNDSVTTKKRNCKNLKQRVQWSTERSATTTRNEYSNKQK
jgi:hypothetical protein